MKYFWMLLLAVGLIACQSNDTAKEKMEEVGEEMNDNVKEGWEDLKDELGIYDSKLDKTVSKLNEDIENASDEARFELVDKREKLQAWQSSLRDKMNEDYSAVKDDWQNFMKETKALLNEINKELNE